MTVSVTEKNAFWMPRRILVPLLSFFLAGFLLIDRQLAIRSEKVAAGVLVLAGVQSLIEAVVLI
jgi:uncharacterized membrane protein YjfL (UPF0719 family)